MTIADAQRILALPPVAQHGGLYCDLCWQRQDNKKPGLEHCGKCPVVAAREVLKQEKERQKRTK